MALQTQGVSPKVIITTVVSGLLGIVVAVLNLVSENPDLLGALPPFLQSLLLILLPPLAVYVAGYQANPGRVLEGSTRPKHVDNGGLS